MSVTIAEFKRHSLCFNFIKTGYKRNKDHGCDEWYPDYTTGFNSGCIIDATQSSCDLLIRGEAGYCPWHPDIAASVDFLYNATNKRTEPLYGACAGIGGQYYET